MRYMIRFTSDHESFRRAEIEALAVLEGVDLKIDHYDPESPYCLVDLSSEDVACRLVRRSILTKGIFEVWGSGATYPELYENLQSHSQHLWPLYKHGSFKFTVDSFQGSRSASEQRELIESFSFLAFDGPIRMKHPEQNFYVHEEWQPAPGGTNKPRISQVHLTRFISGASRDIVAKYDLKKRKYISTTSMDAELALITANISLAAEGKVFYDPFVGTGSFPIACAHFGAMAWGSDIDGRSFKGHFGDTFISDLTNTPVRAARLFDGIICDPPYGVREGLKVLGNRDPTKPKVPIIQDGEPHHLLEGYIPPKRPYSFLAMLDDIVNFAALTLVDGGRLSFWMPTSNDKDEEISPPTHPCLEITSICKQDFNKWSRRLITYRRLEGREVSIEAIHERDQLRGSADALNPFRKRYFEGFKS